MKRGRLAVLSISAPNRKTIPVGLLLVDSDDQLHLRLSEQVLFADPIEMEIWMSLQPDFEQLAVEQGGSAVLDYLSDVASNFFYVGDVEEFWYEALFSSTEYLYRKKVLVPGLFGAEADFEATEYTSDDLAIAAANLPSNPVSRLKLFQSLRSDSVDLIHLEQQINTDPVLAAQLVRLANLTSFSRGEDARSVRQALLRIGTEAALYFAAGASLRTLFSSPRLQAVWQTSLTGLEVLSHMSVSLPQSRPELEFVILIRNIGKLVLLNLPDYDSKLKRYLATGIDEISSEYLLCGRSHAQIGADLLAAWGFPMDLVEAVRFKDVPSKTHEPLASLLFLIESDVNAAGQVAFDLSERDVALLRVGGVRRIKPDSVSTPTESRRSLS